MPMNRFPVIWPSFDPWMPVFDGVPQVGVLKRLKTSARNCRVLRFEGREVFEDRHVDAVESRIVDLASRSAEILNDRGSGEIAVWSEASRIGRVGEGARVIPVGPDEKGVQLKSSA